MTLGMRILNEVKLFQSQMIRNLKTKGFDLDFETFNEECFTFKKSTPYAEIEVIFTFDKIKAEYCPTSLDQTGHFKSSYNFVDYVTGDKAFNHLMNDIKHSENFYRSKK